MGAQERDELEREVARIDAGGETWDDGAPEIELTVKQPLDKVLPIRLSDDHWHELIREAGELGVGPSTLARIWVLERLRELRRAGAPA